MHTDWSRLAPPLPTALTNAYGLTMTHDVARGRTVFLLQESGRNTTWLFGPTAAATVQTHGAGCGGAAGPPALDALGLPTLSNPSFALDLYDAPPAAPAAFLLSAGAASAPFRPCTLLVDPTTLVALPAQANLGGFASLPLPIPGQDSLLGAPLFAQVVVVDGPAPAEKGCRRAVEQHLGRCAIRQGEVDVYRVPLIRPDAKPLVADREALFVVGFDDFSKGGQVDIERSRLFRRARPSPSATSSMPPESCTSTARSCGRVSSLVVGTMCTSPPMKRRRIESGVGTARRWYCECGLRRWSQRVRRSGAPRTEYG